MPANIIDKYIKNVKVMLKSMLSKLVYVRHAEF